MKTDYIYTAFDVSQNTGYSIENIYRLRKKLNLGKLIGKRLWTFCSNDIDIIEGNKKLEKMSPEARQKISEKNRAFRKTKKGREMMAKAWEKRRNNRRM